MPLCERGPLERSLRAAPEFRRAQTEQPGHLGLPPFGADPDVQVDAVLDDLALGDALEEQPRTHSGGIDAGERRALPLRRQSAIEVVPGGETLRRWRDDVPEHLAPEAGDTFRLRAVEGDLDLPHRRHRPTIERKRSGYPWAMSTKRE